MIRTDKTPARDTRLMVLDLDKTVTQQQLFEVFKVYGFIYSLKIDAYADNTSKGVAYIQYNSIEDSERAINDANGKEVNGKAIKV